MQFTSSSKTSSVTAYMSLLLLSKKGQGTFKLEAVLWCFVDMEATYAEYEEWSEHGVPETVVHQYKKALKQMEKCKPLEESLVTDCCLSSAASASLTATLFL